MNVKKNLENRIRGWFPQEPHMISTKVKVNYENRQQPLIIPPEYHVNATKATGVFAIFWIIPVGFITFTILNLERYPVSALQVVTWIIAGLIFGTISNALFTQNQLSRLSKDCQAQGNGKDAPLLIIPIVLFLVLGGFVSWSIGSALQGILISEYAWGISFAMTRSIMFITFEKKEGMRIMQSWSGSGGFVLIPKPPSGRLTIRKQLPRRSYQV